MNNRPHLSSDDEKTCAVLASTSTEHDINKIDKGHYWAMLQSMQLPYPLFFFVHLRSLLNFFLCWINSCKERRNFDKVCRGKFKKVVFIF